MKTGKSNPEDDGMEMKKIALLILLCPALIRAFPQKPEIQVERISVQQGLPDHSINTIMQDNHGFIWIGSNNGIYKYDGYNFTFFRDHPGRPDLPPFKSVYKIQQDKFGFLWIISDAGITVFDPEKEKSVLLYPSSIDSLNVNYYLNPDLLIDRENRIWASSRAGLMKITFRNDSRFCPETDKLNPDTEKNFFCREVVSLCPDKYGPGNIITTLYEDKNGGIWAGCLSGIYFLKKGEDKFIRLDEAPNSASGHEMNDVRAITQIDNNSFWIGTRNSLWLIKNIKQALTDTTPDINLLHFSRKRLKGDQNPMSLLTDRHNNVLLGTNKEIYKINRNPTTDEVTFDLIKSNLSDPEDIGYNKEIQDIFEDRTGLLWVAQSYYGISKFNPSQSQFISYKNLIINNFKSADINPLYKGNDGNLWIGTFGGGLYRIKPGSYSVERYDLTNKVNNIICLREKNDGIFWLGMNTGILEFNAHTGRFTDPLPRSRTGDNLRNAVVWDILKDGSRLFLGTLCGLFVYDIPRQELTQLSLIKNDSVNDNYNAFRSLKKLRNGTILAGTPAQGINKIEIDPVTCEISLVPVITNRLLVSNGISLARRNTIYEDRKGLLWIIDFSGLHSINMTTMEVRNFKLFDKIDFPEAWSITEDNQDNLWIGTHYGLCRFNINTGAVKVFTKENGLPITIHGFNSVYRDPDGRLYFGGIGGFYDFYPDDLKTNDSTPPVVITNFQIYNRPVKIDTAGIGILSENISYTKEIQLAYNQNDFSIEFAALDYNQPSKNKYKYRLEGYQTEWTEADAKDRVARYTKLEPGTYVFKVRASNSDDVWNYEGVSLTIIIHKPWYGTLVAWVIYLIIIISAIFIFLRWRLWRLHRDKDQLENIVRTRTHEIEKQKEKILSQRDRLEQQNRKIIENEELKSRFFANVSHEFRTPLSLIQSPVEELLDKHRKNMKENRKLKMIMRNVHRISGLVNQLLDISKIDNSKMKMELFEDDVMKYLKAIAGEFISMAEKKSIRYNTHFPQQELMTCFDRDKIEKITVNLLSNAFKFTPEGGQVTFNARYTKKSDNENPVCVEFSVSDNGIGIPDESIDKIFDRFYQVEESLKSDSVGTGLGLSLTRDLVKLMHGEITVQSKSKEGSTFTVKLPLGKEHLKDGEYIIMNNAPDIIHLNTTIDPAPETTSEHARVPVKNNFKAVALIIDDNRDIRTQLRDNLEPDYNIYEAVDGIAGLKIANEVIPDIIITDLMMPNMDGLELCKRIKTTELTNHIPIIILTAKDTPEDKIEGLQNGADDYIPKPFSMAELKVRAANLVEQRRKTRERFSREITLDPAGITITSLDEQFLGRAIGIIEKHIHDDQFSLDKFRREMNMSRSTLFRKLHAVTGQSPTEFIRTIRLKRAASLLKQDFGNITQVSFEVGFRSLSYFNRSFKNMYGVTPMEYSRRQE
ncbi:MAG TPA: two-component regulator propeller domain-containing protein [Bacteroidales bacterium]|nr:two-component regulator propeller domain-containing protein [Bacteroidales bacterium]